MRAPQIRASYGLPGELVVDNPQVAEAIVNANARGSTLTAAG